MIEGNSLYDALTHTSELLDVDEAIKILGLTESVVVTEYDGVTDGTHFTSLCIKFMSSGGAHIIIVPSGSTIVILSHKNVRLTLFDSHSHGNDGAVSFSSTCPKGFSSYVQQFVRSSSNQQGLNGSNVFSLSLVV